MQQRDIGGVAKLPSLDDAVFVDASIIDSFSSYREAVLWAWKKRVGNYGMNEKTFQSWLCSNFNYHAPHFSRAVNPDTKSPMDLKADFRPIFEAFVGNRAVTQYMSKINKTTLHEEIQALRA